MDFHSGLSLALELSMSIRDLQSSLDQASIPSSQLNQDNIQPSGPAISIQLNNIIDLFEQVTGALGSDNPSLADFHRQIIEVTEQCQQLQHPNSDLGVNNCMIPPSANVHPSLPQTDVAAHVKHAQFTQSSSGSFVEAFHELNIVQDPDWLLGSSSPSRRTSSRARAPTGSMLEQAEESAWVTCKKVTTLPVDTESSSHELLHQLENTIIGAVEFYKARASALIEHLGKNGASAETTIILSRIDICEGRADNAIETIRTCANYHSNQLGTGQGGSVEEHPAGAACLDLLPTPAPHCRDNWPPMDLDKLFSSPTLSQQSCVGTETGNHSKASAQMEPLLGGLSNLSLNDSPLTSESLLDLPNDWVGARPKVSSIQNSHPQNHVQTTPTVANHTRCFSGLPWVPCSSLGQGSVESQARSGNFSNNRQSAHGSTTHHPIVASILPPETPPPPYPGTGRHGDNETSHYSYGSNCSGHFSTVSRSSNSGVGIRPPAVSAAPDRPSLFPRCTVPSAWNLPRPNNSVQFPKFRPSVNPITSNRPAVYNHVNTVSCPREATSDQFGRFRGSSLLTTSACESPSRDALLSSLRAAARCLANNDRWQQPHGTKKSGQTRYPGNPYNSVAYSVPSCIASRVASIGEPVRSDTNAQINSHVFHGCPVDARASAQGTSSHHSPHVPCEDMGWGGGSQHSRREPEYPGGQQVKFSLPPVTSSESAWSYCRERREPQTTSSWWSDVGSSRPHEYSGGLQDWMRVHGMQRPWSTVPGQLGRGNNQEDFHGPGTNLGETEPEVWEHFSPRSLDMFARQDDYVPDDMPHESLHYSFRLEEMRNLLSGSSSAVRFDGDEETFEHWRADISSSLRRIGCGPEQCLKILLNNTTGEPNKLIRRLMRCSRNHRSTLKEVWSALRANFGNDIMISQKLINRIMSFPKIPDSSRGDSNHSSNVSKMKEFFDLCKQVITNLKTYPDLQLFTSRYGQDVIINKMCPGFVSDWEAHAAFLKRVHHVHRPSLIEILNVMDDYIDRKSYPYVTPTSEYCLAGTRRNFSTRTVSPSAPACTASSGGTRQVASTGVGSQPIPASSTCTVANTPVTPYCPEHRQNIHSLDNCPTYLSWSVDRRRDFVARRKLCYCCLLSHLIKNCPTRTPCSAPSCRGVHHPSLHLSYPPRSVTGANASAMCQRVCGQPLTTGRGCSKTVPVLVRVAGRPERVIRCYCLIDEQSNSSFVDPELPMMLNTSTLAMSYSLQTLSGLTTRYDGGMVQNLEVCGVGEDTWISLPEALTNPHLPDSRHEVATRSIVSAHPHIRQHADHFPTSVEDIPVMMLLGYDCEGAMFTRLYGNQYPYAHHTNLGWAVVGRVCLGSKEPITPTCFRVQTTLNSCEHFSVTPQFPEWCQNQPLEEGNVFLQRPDDEQPGLSQDASEFNRVVEKGTFQSSEGHLVIPLPFKPGFQLPANKASVKHRSVNTLIRIDRKPEIAEKCKETMQKYWDMGHVEQLLPNTPDNPGMTCYVPVFPVVQARKNKVRLVFDSSAKYKGVCLNDCLLRGPNDNNLLTGVLIRFRLEQVAFSADIECMYHMFRVPTEHTDAMRFYWWQNNVPGSPVVPWRALVHVFGNKSSPAAAVFGLRHATRQEIAQDKPEAKTYIRRHFYVDDGMMSTTSVAEAVKVLMDAREILSGYGMRLHKIVSTHPEVLQAFPSSEIAPNQEVKDLKVDSNQSALGVAWNLSEDEIFLRYQDSPRSFTRRAVLSQNGSIFDPLGMVGPVALGGKLLQRKFLSHRSPEQPHTFDWDEPLPGEFLEEWKAWVSNLAMLQQVRVPRAYAGGLTDVVWRGLHVLCDASEEAIAHVVFLQSVNVEGKVEVSFVFGGCRVAPKGATSIARLELCSAVEASHSAAYVVRELDREVNSIRFYTDSLIVLAYLNNKERTFTRYVTSRVSSILGHSSADQWSHVPSLLNVADTGTHYHNAQQLMKSRWLTGPDFLKSTTSLPPMDSVLPHNLPEVLPMRKVMSLRSEAISEQEDWCHRIANRVNSWEKLVRTLAAVLLFVHRCQKLDVDRSTCETMARRRILRRIQQESFGDSFSRLSAGKELLDCDKLLPLSPFLSVGLMRVGGRLKNSPLPYDEKHPILLPARHRVTDLIIRQAHHSVKHQGRHITLAALRQLGYYVLHQSSVIRRMLSSCVICRKLRGPLCKQKMADLPEDRLDMVPPFMKSGVDVFGPYKIHDGKTTRRTSATKKVWVLLCTCLYSRAIHVEVLASLDITSFRLALRRFFSLRGHCKLFKSDCATNFKGSEAVQREELNLDGLVRDAAKEGYTWKFIPPGASHFAGVWERKIGSIKHIFDASIEELGHDNLTREEFTTLICEAAAIVNLTPLGEISSDASDPFPVSPAALLTLRETSDCPNMSAFTQRDLLSYGRLRWKRVQRLAEHFWMRWKNDYLHSLTLRRKWLKPQRNLKVGDVVLTETAERRNDWPMGVIVKVNYDDEGLVRSAHVRLKPSLAGKSRVQERAIHHLVLVLDPTKT